MQPEPQTSPGVWQAEYRSVRYLQDLSGDDLLIRVKELWINLLDLTPDCTIGLDPRFARRWCDALEEVALRNGPYPAGIPNGFFEAASPIDPRSWIARSAAAAVKAHATPHGSYLVKYGAAEHLRRAYSHGEIMVVPASKHAVAENDARRDDERRVNLRPGPRHVRIHSPRVGHLTPHNVTLTSELVTDFYAFCMSKRLSPRLFGAFSTPERGQYCDSCLVITRTDTFLERLNKGVQEALGVPVLAYDGPVVYFDPVLARDEDLTIVFDKELRYEYQDEYRMVWIPTTPCETLAPMVVKLGSLEDCCELIVLAPTTDTAPTPT
jgi:hypothetical protein